MKTEIHSKNINYKYQCINSHRKIHKEKIKGNLIRNRNTVMVGNELSLFAVHDQPTDQKLGADIGDLNSVINNVALIHITEHTHIHKCTHRKWGMPF